MQRPAQRAGLTAEFLEKILEPMQNRPGMLLKNQTSRGQQDAFSPALEKRDSQARFDVAHLLRDGGLRNSEPVRSATKTTRFGDRQEIAEVADLQGIVRHRNRIWSRPLSRRNAAFLLAKFLLP